MFGAVRTQRQKQRDGSRRLIGRSKPGLPGAAIWPGASSAEAKGQLAAIVEHFNDAVFSRRLDGSIATWNRAAERIFGFKASEVIGRSSRFLLPRGHADEFRRLLARMRQGEVIENHETERLRKDGKRVVVSLTLSPVRDGRGRLVGFSTTARDIREQRRAQDALRRSERALADLFDGASLGLAWTTPKGRVLQANRAMLDILECKPEQCLGRLFSKFHSDRAVFAGLLRRAVGRETLRNVQATLRAGSGQIREVLIDGNAFWEDGKIAHLRWFVRDITRRKRLEREVLAISERERSAFSRELHDSLGQQLSGITYLTNVLRDRLREQGSPEGRSVERISLLLKQAIEQTRAVARGLSPVRAEPEGLSRALVELAAQSSELYSIVCRFYSRRPVLVDDNEVATHFYRIAQEAVHNAFRHGQARRIRISLTSLTRQVRLRILDDGRGIGNLSPRRKGLGLRIMQYRAGLLQGAVTVRRLGGKGTEVCCVAPARMPQSGARASK